MHSSLVYNLTFNSTDSHYGAYLLVSGILVVILRYGLRYLLFRYRLRIIKDRNIIVAQYAAEPDIPPAFFGVIIDNRGSIQDIPATIISLAQQGYLSLEYNNQRADFHIQSICTKNTTPTYEHQKYILNLITQKQSIWALALRENTVNMVNEFSFLVLRDLQQAGFYQFDKRMDKMSFSNYYSRIIFRAIHHGLVKPWNWPLFIACLLQPFLAIAWLGLSVIFHNRIGLYHYRTKQWEQRWPELAGYYNYLKLVEAEKRNYELRDIGAFEVQQHDPYLVAALLQPAWSKIFTNSTEIGAGGAEYRES